LTYTDFFGDLRLSQPAMLQVCDSIFPIHEPLYRHTDIGAIGIPMASYIRMPI
jgi:hypothetical protein